MEEKDEGVEERMADAMLLATRDYCAAQTRVERRRAWTAVVDAVELHRKSQSGGCIHPSYEQMQATAREELTALQPAWVQVLRSREGLVLVAGAAVFALCNLLSCLVGALLAK